MPTTAPRQTPRSAFQTDARIRSSVVPTVPTPVQPRPTNTPAVRPKPRVQTGKLLGMTLLASLAMAAGMGYLNLRAQVAREGFRRVTLQKALRREQEQAQIWKQQQAMVNTPTLIEQKARALGMIRADDKQTVTIQ